MVDIVTATSKRIQDLSAAELVVNSYVAPPKAVTNAGDYKTRIDPLVLIPGQSPVGGADIRLTDPNGNPRNEWLGDYKTAINGVDLWTKANHVTTVRRQPYVIVIGNAGHDRYGSLGGPINEEFVLAGNYDDAHKVSSIDLIKNTPSTVLASTYSENFPTDGTTHIPPCVDVFWSILIPFNYIAHAIGNSVGKNIVVDSNGYLHAAHTAYCGVHLHNCVFHVWSLDGGKTWTSEHISAGANRQDQVQIVGDSSDTLHFVWSESVEYIKYRNKTTAGAWSAVEILSANVAGNIYDFTSNPCLNVAPDGVTLGCVWHGPRCSGGVIGYGVWYAARSAGSWGAAEWVATAGNGNGEVQENSVEFDVLGVPHVAYRDGTSGLYYTNRTGGVWAAGTLLSGVHSTYSMSQLVHDLDGNFHVLFSDWVVDDDYDVYYCRRVGGAWDAAVNVAASTAPHFYSPPLSLQVDNTCTPTFVYTTLSGTDLVGTKLRYGGTEVPWYTAAGRSVAGFSIPWSHYPTLNNQYSQLSKQGLCYLFGECDSADFTQGNIFFISDDEGVISDLERPPVLTSTTHRQRGVVDKSLIGGRLISPAIIAL